MTRNTVIISSVKYFFIDLLGSFVYFPIWWYSFGLKKILFFIGKSIIERSRALALKIWLKNLFRPMFADYSRAGRIISFFMRIILLIWRFLALFTWSIYMIILLILWLGAPAFVVYKIFF